MLSPEYLRHFNPRSRVGNDGISHSIRQGTTISIHVPAWGTTTGEITTVAYARISIHVPAWGTTSPSKFHWELRENFNPRSRVGNDREERDLVKRYVISIHVPAWGTTKQHSKMLSFPVFQSTFPRGERLHSDTLLLHGWKFQSTFPRGERQRGRLRPVLL